MARATVKLKWFGSEVLRALRKDMTARLRLMGEFLASDIRRDLSTSTRSAGPSLPGESPHADTGKLRQSITFEVDERKLVARVGTNLEYGKYLEFGTKHMAKRPFLRPSISRNKVRLIDILVKGRLR